MKTKNPDSCLAWHFLYIDCKLGYLDKRPVKVGERLEMQYRNDDTGRKVKTPNDPILCVRGMHASEKILDAMQYAPGPILCRVLVEGDIVKGTDKLCGRYRTVTAMLDSTEILKEVVLEYFARRKRTKKDQIVVKALETALHQNPCPKSLGLPDYISTNFSEDANYAVMQFSNNRISYNVLTGSLKTMVWAEKRLQFHAKEAGLLKKD